MNRPKPTLRSLVLQSAETSRLFGVDFVPLGKCDAAPLDITVDIGRGGVFGNPFRAAPEEKLQGKTLEPYRKWLFAAIKGETWASEQYRQSIGRDLPPDFAKQVQDIVDLPFWCPGCKDHTEEDGVCHGSILRKAAVWLHGDGAKYVKT
jgi:hypothetical protein